MRPFISQTFFSSSVSGALFEKMSLAVADYYLDYGEGGEGGEGGGGDGLNGSHGGEARMMVNNGSDLMQVRNLIFLKKVVSETKVSVAKA